MKQKTRNRKSNTKPVDRVFLIIVSILLVFGLVMFISASLGILAKNEAKFYGVLFNQIVLGFGGGILALIITSRIPYLLWRKYAFYIFICTMILMGLVFIPGLGFSHGGATRWVSLGIVSFQPAELLKIGFVIYLAGWLSWIKNRVKDYRFSVFPLIIMLAISAALLFSQPDTKSFILMLVAGGAMLFVSGIPLKYLVGVGALGGIALGLLLIFTPYLRDRVHTFFNPEFDPRGSSYQLQQSLLAIGSGGITGRGLGQSIQKFDYLPEPQGDSIFAVIGEEFGFIGNVFVILLYLAFCLRGFRIAYYAPDQFGRLLTIGIVILITFQSFLNIASIIGLFPLTGVPLVFISHGGTSLLFSLFAVGIVLNISKYQKLT